VHRVAFWDIGVFNQLSVLDRFADFKPTGLPARHFDGAVCASSRASHLIAWLRELPHISIDGCSEPHTAGRWAWPNSRQRPCASSCTQGTPAGLPLGMPGMAVLIDGAIQQAAQAGRQPGRISTLNAAIGGVRVVEGLGRAVACSPASPAQGHRNIALAEVGRVFTIPLCPPPCGASLRRPHPCCLLKHSMSSSSAVVMPAPRRRWPPPAWAAARCCSATTSRRWGR